MRRSLVAGNWKMHGSRAENAELLDHLVQGADAVGPAQIVVCPPFVYLAEAVKQLHDTVVGVGAQSLCAETVGAYTGEVSGPMLKDVGVRYVIVGHSERRQIYREDDVLVARKFRAAQAAGLVPILCLGETLAEREADATQAVIARQLEAVLAVNEAQSLGNAVLAYEPIWAIGTGKNASPEQAQEVHQFIRQRIALKDARIAADLRIVYGGSVKAANAADLFSMPDVDGGLVGGASLKGEEFLAICAAAV